MIDNSHFLFTQAKKSAESSNILDKKLANFLSTYLESSFINQIQNLDYNDPKELICLKVYHLCRLYSIEGYSIDQESILSDWVFWIVKTYKDYITDQIFKEIESFFRSGFYKELDKSTQISEIPKFLRISAKIIEIGGEKSSYNEIICLKLVPMIWQFIKSISILNCDKNNIIEVLNVVKITQDSQIDLDSTIFHLLMNIIRYIIEKYNYYKINQNINNEDLAQVQEILFYLSKIRTKDLIIQEKVNELIQRYGVREYSSHKNIQNKQNSQEILEIDQNILKFNSIIYSSASRNHMVQVSIYNYNDIKISGKTYKSLNGLPLNFHKIQKEIEIYSILSSRSNDTNCFLRYFCSKLKSNKISLYMEYHPHNLQEILNKLKEINKNTYFSNEELFNLTKKLIYSFSLMQKLNIYHRDIKPSNLLITENKDLKIIDFSSAESKEDIYKAFEDVSVAGTTAYMAPEIFEAYLKGEKVVHANIEKADVFSLGLTILKIITCDDLDRLNLKENNYELLRKVEDLVIEDKIREVLMVMLQVEPNDRFDLEACNQILGSDKTI